MNSFSSKIQCPTCNRSDIRIKAGRYAAHINEQRRMRCEKSGEQADGAKRVQPKRMGPGRKSLLELKVEARYKELFEAQGITTCELQCSDGCHRDNLLQWCHVDKRRYCSVEEWLCFVTLACQACHAETEALPREEMRRIIAAHIEERGWRPTVYAFRELWPALQAYFGKRWVGEILPIIDGEKMFTLEWNGYRDVQMERVQ